MIMSSNIRTMIVSSHITGNNFIHEIPEDEISNYEISNDETLHPIILALIHSSIVGPEPFEDLNEEKNKLSDDEFKNLDIYQEISNCAICMENKKLNIELKCKHVFCRCCIKKWLTEKSNTCPTCRTIIS
jgi:hypothetical protein